MKGYTTGLTGGPGRSNMPLSADVTSLTFVKYESERTYENHKKTQMLWRIYVEGGPHV